MTTELKEKPLNSRYVVLHSVLTLALTLAVLANSLAAQDVAEPNGDANPRGERFKAAQALVSQLEQQLTRVEGLQKQGFASHAETDVVRAELSKARHDVAAMKGDLRGMAENDAALLKVRQRELQRLTVLRNRGHKTEFQITRAKRRVAVCRYLVADKEGRGEDATRALQEAVPLLEHEAELWSTLASNNHAPRIQMSLLLNRLACARNLLAKQNGQPAEIERQFQNAVQLLERDYNRILQLRKRGASSIFEELFSRSSLLNAKVRLANARGENQLVREHVTDLIAINEKLLPIVSRTSSLSYVPENLKGVLQRSIAKDLERDRLRQRSLAQGQKIHDDLSVATLDP